MDVGIKDDLQPCATRPWRKGLDDACSKLPLSGVFDAVHSFDSNLTYLVNVDLGSTTATQKLFQDVGERLNQANLLGVSRLWGDKAQGLQVKGL